MGAIDDIGLKLSRAEVRQTPLVLMSKSTLRTARRRSARSTTHLTTR